MATCCTATQNYTAMRNIANLIISDCALHDQFFLRLETALEPQDSVLAR
jgi:hypothetical protein